MLVQLTIRNLALIAQAEVRLSRGFIAVTGETGAGKSVLLSGLRLVCGAKAVAQMVRHGEEKASVEAIFDLAGLSEVQAKLEEMGIDSDGQELVIQREILANGKSRARVNGTLVNQGDLQDLGELLVQMHGQSEQILLRDPRTQLKLLDDFCAHSETLQRYHEVWATFSRTISAIAETRNKASHLAQQKDFLGFQFEELNKAALRTGEEDEWERIAQEASGSESRRRMVDDALGLLARDGGLVDQTRELVSKLRYLHSRHPDSPDLAEKVSEALDQLQSAEQSLRHLDKGAKHSPQDVEKANSRLAQIQKLKRKYRTDLEGLIALHGQRRAELDSLENLDADLESLERKAQQLRADLLALAARLSESRTTGAAELDRQVEARLRTLGMPQAHFATRLQPCEPGPNGAELVEFQMAPNKGEGTKPLRSCISGGELSRVLLAFKSVLAHRDNVPLLIFDEVDSGISGEIAHSIGTCLHELGQFHQVLTITHLHQVASRAVGHFKVSKSEEFGRTFTHVQALDAEARTREIARMLGDEQSPTVLAHARQLLEESHAHKAHR